MKKILSVLTFFTSVISLHAQDTEPTPVRWAIIKSASQNGTTGRLILSLPAEASTLCYVTKSSDAKNVCTMHGSMTKELPPGTYDITFWGIKIPSVTVEKGRDTRIMAGILNSSVKGLWEVWSSDGIKIFSSGSPKLVALPVGTYNVKTGGAEFKTTINDGKITMFSFTAY